MDQSLQRALIGTPHKLAPFQKNGTAAEDKQDPPAKKKLRLVNQDGAEANGLVNPKVKVQIWNGITNKHVGRFNTAEEAQAARQAALLVLEEQTASRQLIAKGIQRLREDEGSFALGQWSDSGSNQSQHPHWEAWAACDLQLSALKPLLHAMKARPAEWEIGGTVHCR